MKYLKKINEAFYPNDENSVDMNSRNSALDAVPKFIMDELTRPHKNEIENNIGTNDYQMFMIYAKLIEEFVDVSSFKTYMHAISAHRTLPDMVNFFEHILLSEFLKEKGINDILAYGQEKYKEYKSSLGDE